MQSIPKSLLRAIFIAAALIIMSNPTLARTKEPSCTWKNVTAARVDAADAELYRDNDARTNAAIERHLPFGLPFRTGAVQGERMLAQENYLIWYDVNLRVPLWTAHLLTPSDLAIKRTRADSFRSDPRLASNEKSECVDYAEPIFDQGHMVPNGDMTRSNSAMENTFLMSNMTPQHCSFNRGVWQVLEQRIRTWAKHTDKMWVITGAIFDREPPIGRDPNDDAWRMNGKKGRRVAIPSAQYKILVKQRAGGDYETLSILLPNNDTKHANNVIPRIIGGHITTLDNIAQLSGFRFLKDASVLEHPRLWPATEGWARSLSARCKENYPTH